MDYLSDSTKKERRNLLAAGFAGIVVAQLKIYPTEIDVLGLKFQSSDLPFVAVASLCAVIAYFLVKFYLSFLYERSSAQTKALAAQIREGRMAMDIAREEEELNEQARALIQQREVVRKQQENEDARIKRLQDKLDEEAIANVGSLQAMDQKKNDLERALIEQKPELAMIYLPPVQQIRDFDTLWKSIVEKELKMTVENRASFLVQTGRKRQEGIENLENEKNQRKEMYEAQSRELEINETLYEGKRQSIAEWKRVHALAGRVSPIHLFLEIQLPLLVGSIAIWCLISLMLHFPAPPNPPSIPEF